VKKLGIWEQSKQGLREKIEYRFRVLSAAVFTLYSYFKALEYRFRVPTVDSLIWVCSWACAMVPA
jgi:hypothetical protein